MKTLILKQNFLCLTSGICHAKKALQKSQLSLTMIMIVGKEVQKKKTLPAVRNKSGPSRCETNIYSVTPLQHGRSSLNLDSGASRCKIRQKWCTSHSNDDDSLNAKLSSSKIKRRSFKATAIKSPNSMQVKVIAQTGNVQAQMTIKQGIPYEKTELN